jgi:hypothetical protein
MTCRSSGGPHRDDLEGIVMAEGESRRGDRWLFEPAEAAATVVRGTAHELCLVAGQRADAGDTNLTAEGPDADAVLELVRTYA